MLNMVIPVPSWLIFDETLRREAVVNMNISTVGYGFLPWSRVNMDAINRVGSCGQIREELAQRFKLIREPAHGCGQTG